MGFVSALTITFFRYNSEKYFNLFFLIQRELKYTDTLMHAKYQIKFDFIFLLLLSKHLLIAAKTFSQILAILLQCVLYNDNFEWKFIVYRYSASKI